MIPNAFEFLYRVLFSDAGFGATTAIVSWSIPLLFVNHKAAAFTISCGTVLVLVYIVVLFAAMKYDVAGPGSWDRPSEDD